MMSKKIGITVGIIILIVLLPSFVSAYEKLCLGYGDIIEFSECNPQMDDRTCYASLCEFCVYKSAGGAYCPTHPGKCNDVSSCTIVENTTLDIYPPELIINQPEDGFIYSSTSLMVDIKSNEPASIYILDNVKGRGRWKKVSSGIRSYQRNRRFNEGFNNITVKGEDRNGNSKNYFKSFWVDSKKPRIRSTLPKKGFANGLFILEFVEDNPKDVILNYGNSISGYQEKHANIGTDCNTDGRNTIKCEVMVDLSIYDGEKISYWFEVVDIADSSAESKEISLDVDISKPENLVVHMTKEGRYVYFDIEVDDMYLDEITYIDYNDRRPIEKRLCSRFGPGFNHECEARASFKDGDHDVEVVARDMAGNSVNKSLMFLTDSKKPKIKKTYPKKGFANGEFSVEFIEDFPTDVILKYGNTGTGFTETHLNILNDCESQRRGYYCTTNVDLTGFNGDEITYSFKVIDNAVNVVESKPIELMVDTDKPNLLNPSDFFNVLGRYVNFNFAVDEENFDEINYIDSQDTRQMERSLCTRLDSSGICEKKKSFTEGGHILDIIIYDEAGNKLNVPAEFDIIY